MLRVICWAACLLITAQTGFCQESPSNTARGDALVTDYFRRQTRQLSEATFAEIQTLEDWTEKRELYRQQLLDMLGLDPLPSRTPLNAETTGTVKHDEGFLVEKIQFQSLPGLYVTGNLYRPIEQDKPLPAILYVCGHGPSRKEGISYGNKVTYQHHGAWFARNGYVCLTIDTIQLGELEGIHHGTYRHKMWWWNNRGYTPAGVEAWNGVRALDYLQSREEVDDERIGITGRSGGGAYSWWVAAIDDRVRAAVPVAGITNLKNYVVDGCIEGHCDCMFMVNTYRWDYPMIAALVAPRPLLISNTDKDRIFPLDGVIDVHARTRKIYDLYNAGDQLGLQITEGPHKDTQELRVHAFRWFNRFLKGEDALVEKTATKFFEPEQLKVFDELPTNERVTTIHESFVTAVDASDIPNDPTEFDRASAQWMQALKDHVFRGWPKTEEPLDLKVFDTKGVVRLVEYNAQSPYRLELYIFQYIAGEGPPMTIEVLDQESWERVAPALAVPFPDRFPSTPKSMDLWREFEAFTGGGGNFAFVIPRGVGPTEWSRDERQRTHIRRRFMQVGQTVAAMQIYDVHRALQALNAVPNLKWSSLRLEGKGESAFWALYASLWNENIDELVLRDLPTRNREAPDLLNVSRFVEMPHVVLMAASRVDGTSLSSEWKTILGDHHLQKKIHTIRRLTP
ncbi:MAG: acetylxylan esterase [Planctomycetota bacterium]